MSGIPIMAAALLPVGCRDIKIVSLEPINQSYNPHVRTLENWIFSDLIRRQDFETAIRTARSSNVPELQNVQSVEDYLDYINGILHWIPTEAVRPKELLFHSSMMWFVLNQPSVSHYQSPIQPTFETKAEQLESLTWLSRWMVGFSNEIGKFMDTPESAAKLDTFKSNPAYKINDYAEPRGSWKTFNEFFARHVKPGRRPIASIGDSTIVASPVDFVFQEMQDITARSTVTTKGMTWPISQMLAGSPYKNRFANGVWLHGFLDVNDYHRFHAPVSGTVLEARRVLGHNHVQIEPAVSASDTSRMEFDIPNDAGYQFCQSRGLVIIETCYGLVAVLPVGMGIVSSVMLTAEVGAELHKGEELGYFQFGGSDAVLIFENQLNFNSTMKEGQHYQMGAEIGRISCS